MSKDFVQKITGDSVPGRYRLNLADRVVIFCRDGMRVEGNLLGVGDIGLLLETETVDVWLNAEWIVAGAKVRDSGPGEGGGDRFVQPSPPGKQKLAPAADGNEAMNRVFCNGTR